MNRFRNFSVVVALSLTGAAYAQTPAPPDALSPTRLAEAGPISSGMEVKTPAGDSIGTVAAVIPSNGSGTRYVVIASPTGSATAVPYDKASAMIRNDALVMDKSRLRDAPKMQQDQMEDGPSRVWQQKADSYWGK
jgi:hypothetical protein